MLFLPTSCPDCYGFTMEVEVGLDDSYQDPMWWLVATAPSARLRLNARLRKVLSTAGPGRPAEGFAGLSARSAANHEVAFMPTTRNMTPFSAQIQMAIFNAAR